MKYSTICNRKVHNICSCLIWQYAVQHIQQKTLAGRQTHSIYIQLLYHCLIFPTESFTTSTSCHDQRIHENWWNSAPTCRQCAPATAIYHTCLSARDCPTNSGYPTSQHCTRQSHHTACIFNYECSSIWGKSFNRNIFCGILLFLVFALLLLL